ncbi:MAG: ABC transporter permease, partial [Phenylobacterium sp.]
MTGRIWLIAGREFRAYAMTTSFWVALAIGPLLMAGGLLATTHGASKHRDPPSSVLTLERDAKGGVTAEFSPGFPLSEAGRAQILTMVEADGVVRGPVHLAPQKPEKKTDPEALRRFAMVMMLWMTLIGSLGMLLQAVVRERANRALESLLAAAQPVEIVLGKLAGVGAVSLLVMASWLGASAALGALAPASGGAVANLLQGFTKPAMLVQGASVYVLAYAFYGLTT